MIVNFDPADWNQRPCVTALAERIKPITTVIDKPEQIGKPGSHSNVVFINRLHVDRLDPALGEPGFDASEGGKFVSFNVNFEKVNFIDRVRLAVFTEPDRWHHERIGFDKATFLVSSCNHRGNPAENGGVFRHLEAQLPSGIRNGGKVEPDI